MIGYTPGAQTGQWDNRTHCRLARYFPIVRQLFRGFSFPWYQSINPEDFRDETPALSLSFGGLLFQKKHDNI
jgi:hypothetical protein